MCRAFVAVVEPTLLRNAFFRILGGYEGALLVQSIAHDEETVGIPHEIVGTPTVSFIAGIHYFGCCLAEAGIV